MDDEEENDTAVTGKIIRSYLNKDEKEIVLSKYDISSFFVLYANMDRQYFHCEYNNISGQFHYYFLLMLFAYLPDN